MSNSAINYIRDHSRATNGRRMVLMVIADSADEDTWASWLGVPEIAKRAKKSVRAIQKILKQLQESHEIYIEPRYRDDGSRTSNRYTVVHNEPTLERATRLELLRKEADGTSEYMVENQRRLQLGEDWLRFTTPCVEVHHPLYRDSPYPVHRFTIPCPQIHHTLSTDSPLEPSIIPNVSLIEPNGDLKTFDAPSGASHSQANTNPPESEPTTTGVRPPPKRKRQPKANGAPKPKPQAPYHDKLLEVFGLDPQTINSTADKPYWIVAAALFNKGSKPFPLERISELYQYVKDKAEAGNWSTWTVHNLAKYAADFLRDHPAPKVHWVMEPADPNYKPYIPPPDAKPAFSPAEGLALLERMRRPLMEKIGVKHE